MPQTTMTNEETKQKRVGWNRLYIIPLIFGATLIIDTYFYDWLDVQINQYILGYEVTTATLGIAIIIYTIWRILTWQLREE